MVKEKLYVARHLLFITAFINIYFAGVNVSTPVNETTSGIGGPCPQGHYCPQQTEDPIACPNGTYRNAEFGQTVDDCFLCKLPFSINTKLGASEGSVLCGFIKGFSSMQVRWVNIAGHQVFLRQKGTVILDSIVYEEINRPTLSVSYH